MNDTTYIPTADVAKEIRKALKAAFPGVKFSVRSKTYSGGSSIDIYWVDGPTDAQVKEVTGFFQGADFDGMQDLKTYRGAQEYEGRKVRWGVDFIFTHRDFSPEVFKAATRAVCDYWGADFDSLTFRETESYAFKGRITCGYIPENPIVENAGNRYLVDLVRNDLRTQAGHTAGLSR